LRRSILRAMQKAARALGVLGAVAFVASAFVISGLACMDVTTADADRCAADSFLRFGATSLVGAGAAVIGVWLFPRRAFIAAASMITAAGVGLVLLITYGYFVSSLRVFWQVAAAGSSLAAALALASRVRGEASIAPERTAAKSPALAGVLSVLIIGLGHWYLGRWRRALAWEGGLLALAFAVTALNIPDAVLSTVALALAGSSGVDAWRVANEMNAQRQAVEGQLTG